MKKIKKITSLLMLLISLFLLTGCESKNNPDNPTKIETNGETVKVKNLGHKKCTRLASSTGIETNMEYDLYYTNDTLNLLKAKEQVMSSSDDKLDVYEKAYNNIKKNYEGLDYYEQIVTRGDTTVTNEITIYYDKINIKELLEIEGEEDNIIENGKAKLSKWIELAKKFGTKCEDVE